MKNTFKGLSTTLKLSLVFFFVLVFALLNYKSLSDKLDAIDVHDELYNRLSSIRVSIIKLEYTLDMFIVAGRFEDTTISMIKRDVERLDRAISDITGNPAFVEAIKGNNFLSEGFSSISNEWKVTLHEMARLDEASTKDELMLTHNNVDMHTILVTEVSDRLLGVISEGRKAVYRDIGAQALRGFSLLVILYIVAAFVFVWRVSSPAEQLSRTAAEVSSGNFGARFGPYGGGVIGTLSNELNSMLKRIGVELSGNARRIDALDSHVRARGEQMAQLSLLTSYEGKSLSHSEILSTATGLAVSHGPSDAAAVYLKEDSGFRLKASSGFDDFFLKDAPFVPEGAMRDIEAREGKAVFRDIGSFPYERFGKLLKSCGFASVFAAPLRFNGETLGFFIAAAREGNAVFEGETHFIEALASNVSVFIGNVGMYHREHNSKRFLERVLNQVPVGLAIFDTSGKCVFMNGMLRRFLGAGADLQVVGEYSIFEDDVFKGQGMLTSIRKSYDGYSTEFIINYNPALVENHSFTGSPRRLKVRSIPIYDAGGEIFNIALLYEELTDEAGEDAGVNGRPHIA